MTGAELKLEFERQINKSFSQYYTDAEQKELFKKALILSIEDIYKNLSAQHSYDNIDSLIKTNKTFYVNNNAICHAPISITTIVPGNPTIVNTNTTNNLITGDVIYIDKVAGTMSAINNISYTVTVTGDKQFTIAHNSTGLIHTANTGAIVKHSGTTIYSNGFSNPKMIEDYLHLLAIQLKYLFPFTSSIAGPSSRWSLSSIYHSLRPSVNSMAGPSSRWSLPFLYHSF